MAESRETFVPPKRPDRRSAARSGRSGVIKDEVLDEGRRRLLRAAGKLGVGAVVAYALGRTAQAGERDVTSVVDETANVTSAIKGKAGELVDQANPFNDGSDEVINQGVDTGRPQGSTNPETKVERERTEFDLLFPWLKESEREGAYNAVKGARIQMDKNINFEVIKRIAGLEDLIRRSASEHGVPEELLIGLVIVESKGDPKAESFKDRLWENRARGLTQIMIPMAKKLGLRVSQGGDDERFIPEKVLPLTAQELKEAFVRHGNWGDAVQEWHMGEKHLYQFKNQFLSNIGVRIIDIYDGRNKSSEEVIRLKEQYKLANEKNRLNIFRLFRDDEEIKRTIAHPSWDNTEEYAPRILASIDIYNADKGKV